MEESHLLLARLVVGAAVSHRDTTARSAPAQGGGRPGTGAGHGLLLLDHELPLQLPDVVLEERDVLLEARDLHLSPLLQALELLFRLLQLVLERFELLIVHLLQVPVLLAEGVHVLLALGHLVEQVPVVHLGPLLLLDLALVSRSVVTGGP